MRKLFLLMMALFISSVGMLRADELTVCDGTVNNGQVPVYGLYADAFHRAQFIMPASELLDMEGGQITEMKFYSTSNYPSVSWTGTFSAYLKEVEQTSINAYINPATATEVYQGRVSVANHVMTIAFNTPFAYEGGNLLIGFDCIDKGNFLACFFTGRNANGACVAGYNYSSMAQIDCYQKNFLPKTTFVYTIGPIAPLAVDPNPVNLGSRPNGAWMRPFEATVSSRIGTTQVTAIDSDNPYFVMQGLELPATVSRSEHYTFNITTGEAEPGRIEANLALINADGRGASIVPIRAYAYNPICPDVWELAREVTSFPYTERNPNTYIADNYQLPGTTPDGPDEVFKVTFANDVVFSTDFEPIINKGEGGRDAYSFKSAIYAEDFNGEPGPGPDNAFSFDVINDDFVEDFETGVISNAWTNDAAYPWVISQGNAYEGSYCAKSGNNGVGSSESKLTLNRMVATDGVVVFYMKFSGEGGSWDIPKFYLDGVLKTPANSWPSGGNNWTRYEYPVTAGEHTFTWAFRKDSSVNQGQDCAWVDNISIGTPDDRSTDVITDMFVPAGTYYVVTSAKNVDYHVTLKADAAPAPIIASNPRPADGANEVNSPVNLKWTLGEYTKEYQLVFGTTYPPTEVVVDWTSELRESYRTAELFNNTQYFWQVNERNSTGTTNGPVWGFTTTINVPQNLTAAETELYLGDVAEFTWNANTRAFRGYNIYQDGEKLNTTLLTNTTFSVAGLEYNMDGYEFNVTAVYDEGESAYSNTVTIYVTGEGSVSGHVYDQDGVTPIEGATVTFNGVDEHGNDVEVTFTTGADGAYAGNILAGEYDAVANAEGFDAVEYPEVVEIVYNEETENIDFVLHETYYPVGEVIAEEINDNQVKVHWAMTAGGGGGTTAGIVEDFETGDFSNMEWNNTVSNYPWEITTNNPYEGSYCMKSTCEGVSNGISSIQISVEVPFDGLMSFYSKISAEANYDFGLFLMDGQLKGEWSGNGNWAKREYEVTTGTHTFLWIYEKDSSMDKFDDCFYVDMIDFCHEPEPAQPGWLFYDDGTNNDAIGLAQGGSFYWGVMFPASQMASYQGYNLTKVAYFDYAAHTGKVMIYQGGDNAPGTLVHQQNYTANGTEQYVEWDLTSAIPVDPTKNLWIVMNNDNGQYVASNCSDQGNANGRWVSMDGVEWIDIAGEGIPCTWNLRGYVTNRTGRKVAISDMTPLTFVNNATGGELASDPKAAERGVINTTMATRSFQYYNVYRTDCYNATEPELKASHIQDTMFMDMAWGETPAGVYKWGVSRIYEGNRAVESEIVWSNCLDKDMLTTVDVTVSTNSQDSPEGTTVTLVNVSEPGMGYDYEVTLDATGYYAWNEFRKGTYTVNIEKEGFEGCYDGEEMLIWDATSLECLLVEVASPVEGLYTSHTGWAMWEGQDIPTPPVPPTPSGDEFEFNFDNDMQGWTTIDADGDGHNFLILSSVIMSNGYGHNASDDALSSQSYINDFGPLTPDNYVVTPQKYAIGETSELSFWACGQDGAWAAEHFGVAISTTGNTSAADFTTIQEWTMTAKGERYEGARGSRDQGNWYNYTVDLSAYAGQEVWIAFRHFNCSDMFMLNIDDATLTVAPGDRYVQSYNVYLGDVLEGTTTRSFFQHNVENLVEGEEYLTTVEAVYSSGVTEASEYAWIYKPCDNYAGTVDGVTAEVVGQDALVSWTYPATDTVVPNPSGDEFEFNFDNDMQGWTTIDADGDGHNFLILSSVIMATGNGHNASNDALSSQSYINDFGPLTPDNYVVSPQKYAIGSNSVFNFWACGQDAGWAAEHFGVAISTTGNTSAADFTTIQEWTMTAKGERYEGARGSREQGNWYNYTVDLSAYAGQEVWIAVRHFNCTDMFMLNVDDFVLSADGRTREAVTYNFDNDMQGWTTIDADGDGHNFLILSSVIMATGNGYNASNDALSSQSYINDFGPLTPDNYVVSPQKFAVGQGSSISFWACGQDAGWAAEHFGVAISTTGNTSAADFTTIQEWTMTAKGERYEGARGTREQGNWYEYTVDLSAYAGQEVWVAIRHFNCTDMFMLNVDDVTINTGSVTPPVPAGNILGAVIFRDGEYLAFTEDNEYTDVNPGDGEHEYCVRVVYDGPMDGTYYSMSCTECAEVSMQLTCDAPENLNGEYVWNTASEFGAKISWGEQVIPVESWMFYDDGTNIDAIGLGQGGSFYWGIMIPSSLLQPYAGTSLTKVAYFDYAAHTGKVMIYQGGATAPGTLVHQQNYTANGTAQYVEWELTSAIPVDVTQNLWIVMNNNDGQYVAACGANTGDANGRWVSIDGTEWIDITAAGLDVTWNLRGFVTNTRTGELVPVEAPALNGTPGATLVNAGVSRQGDVVMDFTARDLALVSYKVYRSTSNDNYSLIATVPAVEGQDYYEYFDDIDAGTYYYQVTAYYEGTSGTCESEPAISATNPANDYVVVTVTSVDGAENNARVYPNPTNGNVTIEAVGMKQITVVSALGQVVYDRQVNSDSEMLNMAEYKAGIYMVRIATENGVSVQRVTVVR